MTSAELNLGSLPILNLGLFQWSDEWSNREVDLGTVSGTAENKAGAAPEVTIVKAAVPALRSLLTAPPISASIYDFPLATTA